MAMRVAVAAAQMTENFLEIR